MSFVWGLFSCGGLVVAAVALFFFKVWLDEKLNWFRWRRAGPRMLRDEPPPLPAELWPGRETRGWRVVDLDRVTETPHRLVRHAVVRPGRVIHAVQQSDAQEIDGHVIYAFRRLDDSVEVTQKVSPNNSFFAGEWIHVLIDPQDGAHVIYEELQPSARQPVVLPPLRPAPARSGRPLLPGPAPQAPTTSLDDTSVESFPRAPPNIHSFPRTPQFTTLVAPSPADEQQVLREALALFPTLPTNEDNGDRRVVADMLVERGFARGEFIALQLQEQPTNAYRARIAELLRTHAEAWLPPGADPRRSEFRRGFAWSVLLTGATDVQHCEWPFIRHVAVGSPGGPGLFDGFEQLTLTSLTGVEPLALWYLIRGGFPRGVQHLELAMPLPELLPHAERLRQLPPMELLSLRARRQELTPSALASMLDAVPSPQRVRLSLQWGDVRGFQREVARRPWLRSLELVSLESTASTLVLEITAENFRVVTTGKLDAAAWKALSTALRAQGFSSIPLFVSETGARREQPLG